MCACENTFCGRVWAATRGSPFAVLQGTAHSCHVIWALSVFCLGRVTAVAVLAPVHPQRYICTPGEFWVLNCFCFCCGSEAKRRNRASDDAGEVR